MVRCQLHNGRRGGGVPAAVLDERVVVAGRFDDRLGRGQGPLGQLVEGVLELVGLAYDRDHPAYQGRIEVDDGGGDEVGEGRLARCQPEALVELRTGDGSGEDRVQD